MIDDPFSELPSDVSPGTRHEYISLDRLIKYGAHLHAMLVKQCPHLEDTHTHTCMQSSVRCIDQSRPCWTHSTHTHTHTHQPAALTPVPEAEAPSTPMPVLHEAVEAVPDVDPSELPFSAGIPPGHPEAAMPAKTSPEFDETFLQANADRISDQRMYQTSGSSTFFEHAYDENLATGEICNEAGVGVIPHDLHDITQADDRKSADASVDLPSNDSTPWQHMNVHRHG